VKSLRVIGSCSTCRRALKEDGGDGSCPRVASYADLKAQGLHDCPLFRRRPQPRVKPDTSAQEELF